MSKAMTWGAAGGQLGAGLELSVPILWGSARQLLDDFGILVLDAVRDASEHLVERYSRPRPQQGVCVGRHGA
jgi:hypothetical protein